MIAAVERVGGSVTAIGEVRPSFDEVFGQLVTRSIAASREASGVGSGCRPMRLLKRPLRVLAIMGKEIVETLRRPRALVGIIAGPVLILGLFGLGFVGQPALRTVVLVPPGQQLADRSGGVRRGGDRSDRASSA